MDETVRAALLMVLGKVDKDTTFSEQEVALLEEARDALEANPPLAEVEGWMLKRWEEGVAKTTLNLLCDNDPGDVGTPVTVTVRKRAVLG